jgi:hypothetical protein
VFYPPAGNYIVSLGTASTLQVWDSQALTWRNTTVIASQFVPFDSDGINWRITNLSGQVLSIGVSAAGTGAPTNGINPAGVALTIPAAGGGNNAQGYPIIGGALAGGITVTAPGSGFLVPPIIVIDPPPVGGIQATAVCTITAGAIATATVVVAGAGYAATPQIWVLPQFQFNPDQPLPPGSAVIPSAVPPGVIGLPPPGAHPFIPTGVVPTSGGAILNWTSGTPLSASSGTVTGVTVTYGGGGYSGTVTPTITGAGAATLNTTLGAAGANDTSYLWPAITS